tara:strand:+ start:1076 stop:1486 length:411 start_codon:yes stop_codon:yes gene_type:complete
MKKYHTLDLEHNFDFVVLAINSHSKVYKFCWNLNQIDGINFELDKTHKINNTVIINRYKSVDSEGVTINLLSNRSKTGYLIPSQKSVNYFLIISTFDWITIKHDFLINLRALDDVLLAYEFDLINEKNSDRFIIYD